MQRDIDSKMVPQTHVCDVNHEMFCYICSKLEVTSLRKLIDVKCMLVLLLIYLFINLPTNVLNMFLSLLEIPDVIGFNRFWI